MTSIKLSTWAKNNGYSYHGAYKLFKAGGIPDAVQHPNGTILVGTTKTETSKPTKIVTYARVSTPKQKSDLDSQSNRLSEFCISRGYVVDHQVKEVASGLNDARPKLQKILDDDSITHIIVENKDRLTRFGFNYIDLFLKKRGVELIVCNRSDEKDVDLMQDFVSIITSMAARVYGARRFANKRQRIIDILEDQDSEKTK
jgi:putative resolvase